MEIWSKCDICGRDIPVGELCYGLKRGNCICENCCTGFENCTFTLAPMPTLTPPNEWVSVEERLPDTAGEFLVVYHPCYGDKVTSEIRVGIDSFRGKTAWAKRKYQRVTHWMPLPESPKEELKNATN